MTSPRLALDPTLTLAFAMHNTKGGYALLLGSGVSRAAAIPTGWEVIQDLARRLAVMEGIDPGLEVLEARRSLPSASPEASDSQVRARLGAACRSAASKSPLPRPARLA